MDHVVDSVLLSLCTFFLVTVVLLAARLSRLRHQLQPRAAPPAVAAETVEQRASDDDGLVVPVVGVLRSVYPTRNGTPRQPQLVPSSRGVLLVPAGDESERLRAGLQGAEHVWLTFVFHSNTNQHKQTFRPKIRPPRLGRAFVGVFSTRTPHRPNPVGLSLCRLQRLHTDVDGALHVHLAGVDLVDGTPVVAVDAYTPGRAPPHSAVPAWLEQPLEQLPRQRVTWSQSALDTIAAAWRPGAPPPASLYDSAEQVQRFVEQTLTFDIRSVRHKQRGIDGRTDKLSYRVYLDTVDVEWSVVEPGVALIEHVDVLERPGYTPLNPATAESITFRSARNE